MESLIDGVRQRLHTQLFEVDDQLKSMGDLIEAVRGGKGGSAIVYGQEEDGRSALVDQALMKHANGVKTKHLWLSRFGTEANALQELLDSETSKESCIIVVDSADDLVCKSKQALLYRLLDRAKTSAWLVLLIITNQNMIASLEKRVRSRLPNTRVLLGEEIPKEKWNTLFRSLLGKEEQKENAPSKKKSKKNNNKQQTSEEEVLAEFMERFLADQDVKNEMDRLCKWSGHLAVVKRTLNWWLIQIEAKDIEQAMDSSLDVVSSRAAFRRIIDEFISSVNAVIPTNDAVEMAINNLSRRSFCVLTAAARRLRCNPEGSFSYDKINVDFMHQCNTVDKRMLPDAALQTYKELDRLCEMGVLATVGSSSHAHSFRQIRINCHLPLLLSAVRTGFGQNTGLKEWFETQPIN